MASRYRTVGRGAAVDESLFGERKSEVVKANIIRSSSAGTRRVSAPSISQATVLTKQEFERMKNLAVLKSEAELASEKEQAIRMREERDRQARQRKERMKQLETAAKAKATLSDEDVARIARDKAIKDAATQQIDDRNEVVKQLSSMSARAVAFTLREKQIEEKHRREQIEREYDRSLDMGMEIDRIQDLLHREEEEERKKAKRVAAREVITQQMAQRQREKFLAAEMREQENLAMRNLMKKYEQDDAVLAEKKKLEIERSRMEVIRANEAAIARKQESKLLAKKEIEDILIYQALKDAELSKREEEERALERAKKERQAMLLAQQEKAQNNAGKLDEIRARRAAEEHERRARLKEKEEKIKRKAEMDELLASRAIQADDRRKRELLTKEKEKDEVENALRYMATMAARESSELSMKKEMAAKHRSNILSQIDDSEKARREMRNARMNEGTHLRQERIQEIAKYGVIRDQMVADLASKGVHPRYLSEMKNVDVEKILRK